MATSFPTGLDVLTNPTSADSLASPDHAAQHANVNDAVEAIEAAIGLTSSPVLARLASPTFTGTPTLPTGTIATTQTAADSSTKVATTAFVTSAVGTVTSATRALIGGGSVTITPVASTMTSGSVSWGTTLSASPKVTVTANSSSALVTHTAWTSESTTGVTVWILRTNTVATRVDAIGIVS